MTHYIKLKKAMEMLFLLIQKIILHTQMKNY